MNRRKGQSLLESALAMVVLMALLVAIVDFAHVVYIHQNLAEHVRETARWAVVRPIDPEAIRQRLLAGSGGASPYLGLRPANLVVEHLDPGTPQERLHVAIVNYEVHLMTPGLAGIVRKSDIASETIPVEWRP